MAFDDFSKTDKVEGLENAETQKLESGAAKKEQTEIEGLEAKNKLGEVKEVDPDGDEAQDVTENPEKKKYKVDREDEISRVESLGFKVEDMDGEPCLCRESGDKIMSVDEHIALRENSVYNLNSNTLVLGKHHEEGSPDRDKSYDVIAKNEGKKYFQMDKGDYDELQNDIGLSEGEIFDLYNKPVLDEAFSEGNIEFTGDPRDMLKKDDGGLSYTGREYIYLQEYADEQGEKMILINNNGRYEVSFIKPTNHL